MPNFRQVQVGEVALRVALQGGGPLVVMVHGFPESWYSWRHQMGPIGAAGFTACAIDVRGYGGSDKPHEVEAYSLEHLSGDVAGLIAALSPDKPAVVIGHDWGAPIAWDHGPRSSRPQVNHAEIVAHITSVNGGFQLPAISQFLNPMTEAGRAALDAVITRQAQIIAYIDDYKLLMIATLVMLPLFMVFTRIADGGKGHTTVEL
jgi:pimeloyl-ACP methyl ester carboxylesterase